MEVYLVRHTKVDVQANTCYGQSDVKLALNFYDEFESVKEKIPNSLEFILYTSPLSRCKKLAETIPSKEIKVEPRLLELNFGDWELKNWNDISKEEFDTWHSDFVNNPVPNGESYLDLSRRVVSFWAETVFKNQSAIFITHSGIIRALLSYVLFIPLEHSFRIKIDYGGITKITLNENFISVDYINT